MARQRGNSWVADVVIDGERVRRSFKTEWEARRFEVGVEMCVSPTVGTLFKEAYDYHWKGSRDQSNAWLIVNELITLLGCDRPVTEVTTSEVLRLTAMWRGKRLSDKTINRKLSKISMCMKYAHSKDTQVSIPQTHRFKESQGRIRFLTEGEAAALLSSFANEKYGRFATFLLYTGCRYSEAVNLQWSDVTDTTVTFWKTKSDKPRTVPLTNQAKQTLVRGAGGPRSDKPWNINYDAFHAAFMQAKELAGLGHDRQIVIHTLRHTCASWLVQKGVDIRRVKDWMGHSKVDTTLIYAHLAPDDLMSAMSALEG